MSGMLDLSMDGGFLPAFSSSVARLSSVALAKEDRAKEESLTVYWLVPFISVSRIKGSYIRPLAVAEG